MKVIEKCCFQDAASRKNTVVQTDRVFRRGGSATADGIASEAPTRPTAPAATPDSCGRTRISLSQKRNSIQSLVQAVIFVLWFSGARQATRVSGRRRGATAWLIVRTIRTRRGVLVSKCAVNLESWIFDLLRSTLGRKADQSDSGSTHKSRNQTKLNLTYPNLTKLNLT